MNTLNSSNMLYLKDIPKLSNIIDTIKFPSVLTDHEEEELLESMLYVLDEYIHENIRIFEQSSYKTILEEYIHNEIYMILSLVIDENIDDIVVELTAKVLYYYFNIHPRRSYSKNYVIHKQSEEDKTDIQSKIDIIEDKNKCEPEQCTPGWYERRKKLLTASSIWKCLDTESSKNAFIYDNCKPVDPGKYEYVNENSPFHWGHKFEPVAQAVYEYMFDSTIKEYGCIPHSDYNFLGASPDGINIKYDSERFGRMLEIKCPSTRIPNGIPSKAYWIQMQLQMECCNLNECDFLECVFREYDTKEQFMKDGNSFNKTKDNRLKGLMLKFYNNNKPYYEYCPLSYNIDQIDSWKSKIVGSKDELSIYSGEIYWHMEYYTCILVERNKLWFNTVVDQFEEVWKTIVNERETGFEHRKRTKKLPEKGKVCSNLFLSVKKIQAPQYGKSIEEDMNSTSPMCDSKSKTKTGPKPATSLFNQFNKDSKLNIESTIYNTTTKIQETDQDADNNTNKDNTNKDKDNDNKNNIVHKDKQSKTIKKNVATKSKKIIINIDI